MTDLQFWKLALDGALVFSLAYMCYRFKNIGGPSVNVGHLRELEASLRKLLKEADRSSIMLGEELAKKKGQLEQLLFDLETAEQRVNRSIDDASEAKRALRDIGQRVNQERESSLVEPRSEGRVQPTPVAEPVYREPSRPQREVSEQQVHYSYDSIPEPPSFDNLGGRAASQPQKTMPEPRQKPAPDVPLNIYGEPIHTESPEQNAPLRETIEREVMPDASAEEAPVEQSLEDLYGAADDLLRAGQSLEHVARTTHLPMDEVKMLSELISREQVVHEQQEQSPVKRETQVL